MKGFVVQIGDRFGSDLNRQTSPLFERGVILAPVANAVRGFLYPWQGKHAMTPRSQFFSSDSCNKALSINNNQVVTVNSCRD